MSADRGAEPAPEAPGVVMPSMRALLAASAAAEAVCTPPADLPADRGTTTSPASPASPASAKEPVRDASGDEDEGSPGQRDAA